MVLRENINALYENGKRGVLKELKEYKNGCLEIPSSYFLERKCKLFAK